MPTSVMFVQQLNKETGELEWAAVGTNEHQFGEQGEPMPNRLAWHWLLLPNILLNYKLQL